MKKKALILLSCILAAGIATGCASMGGAPQGDNAPQTGSEELQLLSAGWPSDFEVEPHVEPPFADDPNRTNNAFNVQDFGEQGSNGWFYRYGDSKRPERSEQITNFDGEKYFQSGAKGLEIKKNFLHTSEEASPILEWRAAQNGKVNVALTYVKNVNGDKNPSYPDGVQILVYKGKELLKLENVDISTTEENLAEISIQDLEVVKGESLYFVVDKRANNAFDGGSLYVGISDVNRKDSAPSGSGPRKDNNANSVTDFGAQGSNGWSYLYGTTPKDCQTVSNENQGEYINATSPNLSISQGFIHPAINHNAVLRWTPAVKGSVDLRVKYTKFEQNDGNPDFPDGVKVKVYKNDQLLYEEHVDAPDQGENKIKHREAKLSVSPSDQLYFMVDAEGNSSYDGGAFDITVIDIGAAKTESSVSVKQPDTRQNFADVMEDFGTQGSNGWIFQSGYEDDPFHAYNLDTFNKKEDRYFDSSWLEIKRDYVNVGEHGRSAVIKWRVAQNGKVKIRASYTKMKNEDANPAWPDGTRVSVYYNDSLLRQQSFAPEVNKEVTKRLDVSSLKVKKGAYITMVINGLENNAYDGGKYEFAISSISGLVGKTEKDVKATYDGAKENFASTKDDFGKQGHNGWYNQYSYYDNPFFAVNVELCENQEKYYTSDGVEIKKDYIVPSNKGKCAQVKWVAAKSGKINIDLEYTKLKNEDANPAWPDGVTVYLMKNRKVLGKRYFAPLRRKEVTKSLAKDKVSVRKGDCITMIVDPGKNSAYDGGKYMFVIEDSAKVPKVKAGNWDNDTSLSALTSMKQGTDGWFFLEGRSPESAKVLTKMNEDKTGYASRRTDGLEMRNNFVHTGDLDPIYQWVVGKDGKIDVAGDYVKFGQEDTNPDWPDGVTVKIWKNHKQLFKKKVKVKRGDGNDNAISFDFAGMSVKRGDKLSFQICSDKNWAWDGGRLSVVVEPSSTLKMKPGEDNSTILSALESMEQGTDGWYFCEGTSLAKARPLTKLTEDKTGYVSKRTEGLEMRKDFVHAGDKQDPIYQWIVAEDGKIDVDGSYLKYGQEDANPDWPDGVTVKIWHNDRSLLSKKVKVKRGDGNNNAISFSFAKLKVKRGDKLSFQICSDKNWAWDGGQLSVVVEPSSDIKLTPGEDNNTILGNIKSMDQGTDGWWFMKGTSAADAKLLKNRNEDQSAYISGKDSGLEMKKDYVHPGALQSPIYKWVVKDSGKLDVRGSYVKFGHNDGNPDWPDGITLIISQNDKQIFKETVKALQGDGNDNSVSFDFKELDVKAGDIFSFQISPNSNNAWDAGKLSVTIGDENASQPDEVTPDPNRSNSANLADDFSDKQGSNGWYYGTCNYAGEGFAEISDYADGAYKDGVAELKKDFIHPGSGTNAAYKWVAAQDGNIKVAGKYTKFDGGKTDIRIRQTGNSDDHFQTADSGAEISIDLTLAVKKGDELLFQVDPSGEADNDGGRFEISISPANGLEIQAAAPFVSLADDIANRMEPELGQDEKAAEDEKVEPATEEAAEEEKEKSNSEEAAESGEKAEEKAERKDKTKSEEKNGDKEDKSQKTEPEAEEAQPEAEEPEPEKEGESEAEEAAEPESADSEEQSEEKGEDQAGPEEKTEGKEKAEAQEKKEVKDEAEKKAESKEEKKENTITCEECIFRVADEEKEQSFKVKAKAKGKAELSYRSDNKKVKVEDGKVRVPKGFLGQVTITINAAETDEYQAAELETVIMVGPAPVSVDKVKSDKKSQITVSWKENEDAAGYEVQYSRDKNFGEAAKNSSRKKKANKKAKTVKIKKHQTVRTSVRKLKKGTWYVRVRSVKKNACSDWSKSKKVKVK